MEVLPEPEGLWAPDEFGPRVFVKYRFKKGRAKIGEGTIQYRKTGDSAYSLWFGTNARHRGKGYGRLAYSMIEEDMKKRGVKRITGVPNGPKAQAFMEATEK